MKLEYLPDGSLDCPLIRLYDFGANEATKLRQYVNKLANGSSNKYALHHLDFIQSIDDCQLDFVVGEKDKGILTTTMANQFICVLSQESWEWVGELIEPFCQIARSNTYQWLDETSNISLLFSPSGYW